MSESLDRSYTLSNRDDSGKREFWACLALRESAGLGMRRIARLLSRFGSGYEAVRSVAAWSEAGVPSSCGKEFAKEKWRQKAGVEWVAAKTSQCGILFWTDSEYPDWLRSIADPPPFLYFFGDVALLQNPAVALVGMRSCSEEGLKAAVHIGRGLAAAGVTIVSGMARGVDRAAHLAGLEGAGGSIGVLGGGIDHVYPKQNEDLYALMRRQGLLVSELPPGAKPEEGSFPIRNRLISGLSHAVVVIEAAVRSGSLNTAKHALEQNRELMAVPGPVTASSARGCQELVRRGAKPVFCADDVLREIVPHLQERIKQGVLARDLQRFQAVKTLEPDADEVSRSLCEGLLPWRAFDGKARKRRAASASVAAPAPAPVVDDAQTIPAVELTGLEADVFALVLKKPVHVDDICRSLGQDVAVVSRIVVMLEVQGLLSRLPGMLYTVRQGGI